MKKTYRIRSLVLTLVVFMIGVSLPVQAAWTEGEVTILSMSEFLPLLSANMGLNTNTDLPGSTPVILPVGIPRNNPKAVAIALVNSGLGLQQVDKATVKVVVGLGPASEAAEMRRKVIFPVAPAAKSAGAIDKGGALLYGQIVAPPYQVEVAGDQVLINGVAVYPTPGLPGPAPDKAVNDLVAGMDRAREIYDREVMDLGEKTARFNLQQNMETVTGIETAEWLDDNRLSLRMSDGDEEILVLQGDGRDANPPTPADIAANLRQLAADLSETLRQDFTVCAGTTYLTTAPERGATALRNRLREILASGEDENLKLLRLEARTGHRDAAADMLYAR